MKQLTKLILGIVMLPLLTLMACSDSKMENRIDGTWKCVYTESEDGAKMKATETVTYDAANHTFEGKISMNVVSPISFHLATVTYSGTWKATKHRLLGEIDKNSVEFNFNTNMIDSSDRREMREEFMSELEDGDFVDGGKIIMISHDKLIIKDEEDGTLYNYKRVN